MNSRGVRNAWRIMNRISTWALDHFSRRLQWSWSGNLTPCSIRTKRFWRSWSSGGNTLGGRYGVGYCTPCAGNSIGMAQTHGYVLGKYLAKK